MSDEAIQTICSTIMFLAIGWYLFVYDGKGSK